MGWFFVVDHEPIAERQVCVAAFFVKTFIHGPSSSRLAETGRRSTDWIVTERGLRSSPFDSRQLTSQIDGDLVHVIDVAVGLAELAREDRLRGMRHVIAGLVGRAAKPPCIASMIVLVVRDMSPVLPMRLHVADPGFFGLIECAGFGIVYLDMTREVERRGDCIAFVPPQRMRWRDGYESSPYAAWLAQENAVEARYCILPGKLVGFSIPRA
ncbi:hypothetical protein A3726_00435 [Erythrobacter sp. HI0037]|nr:hypothetical protein A3719_02605 [Erythrobacter sp. HI0020]KZY16661.1 hypothetical protein A3727_00620 [Erythrobacter sp. HI0038]KZY29010.1 hypothetical protein A3726_00435 [Erythrobacter sp. HI0037]